jgi:hypothetical protein
VTLLLTVGDGLQTGPQASSEVPNVRCVLSLSRVAWGRSMTRLAGHCPCWPHDQGCLISCLKGDRPCSEMPGLGWVLAGP